MLENHRHPDEEQMERYSMGDLSDEETARFEEHLLVCESCQQHVISSDDYVSTMHSASTRIRQQGRRSRNPWWLFPRWTPVLAGATVMLLLGVLGLRWAASRNNGKPQPALAIALVATRGEEIRAKAPPGRTLALRADLTGLPPETSFRLELVDAQGKPVWHGDVAPREIQATPAVSGLSPGLYFLRAFTPSGKLLREYGLEVESH